MYDQCSSIISERSTDVMLIHREAYLCLLSTLGMSKKSDHWSLGSANRKHLGQSPPICNWEATDNGQEKKKGNIRCCFLRTCRTKCSILRPTIPSASLGFSKRHQLTTHFGPNHRRAKWQCVLRILHVGLISPNIDFMHYLSGWFRIEPDEDIASRRSSDIACVSNGPHTSIGIHLTYRPHAS